MEIDSWLNNENSGYSNDFSDSHIGVIFGNGNISSWYDLCDDTAGQCATEYSLRDDTFVQTNTASADYSLTPYCSYFCGVRNATCTVWIDYDSLGQTLEVCFSSTSLQATSAKPDKSNDYGSQPSSE
jgi:hypothetical protein